MEVRTGWEFNLANQLNLNPKNGVRLYRVYNGGTAARLDTSLALNIQTRQVKSEGVMGFSPKLTHLCLLFCHRINIG